MTNRCMYALTHTWIHAHHSITQAHTHKPYKMYVHTYLYQSERRHSTHRPAPRDGSMAVNSQCIHGHNSHTSHWIHTDDDVRSQSTSLHCMHHSNTVSHDDIMHVFCACMNRMLHTRTQHTTVMSQLCHIASRCRASQSTHSINKSIVNDQSTNQSHQIASIKGHLMGVLLRANPSPC